MTTATKPRGKDIVEIAQELKRIRETSKDFVVHPGVMEMDHRGDVAVHGNRGALFVKPTNWAHQQVASYLDIPKSYYDRMLGENRSLLAQNVNTWLQQKAPEERRMLRTVDGKLRGFLSSRYRRLDSYDLMNAIFPTLQENNMHIISAELTERRLYIKATHPKMRGMVKAGDEVIGGVTISTSDVGAGSLRIEPYTLRLVCTNGLISESAIRKYHVGKDASEEALFHILSDEANEADDRAFFLKVRDVLLDSIRPESFAKQVDRFKVAAGDEIKRVGDLQEVVELASRYTGLTNKGIREDILAQLATGNEGAGLTRWGLANSFTAVAKKTSIDYDTSVELERAGGVIINLAPNDWKKIAC